MNEFYVLLPTADLPSVEEWRKRVKELEPAFSLDAGYDPKKGGVWACTYKDEDGSATFCCDFSMEDSADLFEKAPELVEYTNNCRAVAVFYAEDEEDDTNIAAAYAIAEALLSLVPGGFLFDPFEGQLMHGEDAVVFFHEELALEEEE